jgi:hypothetical protein
MVRSLSNAIGPVISRPSTFAGDAPWQDLGIEFPVLPVEHFGGSRKIPQQSKWGTGQDLA